jgi:hypothetical protein
MYKLFFGYKYTSSTGFNTENDVPLFNTLKESLDWVTAKLIIENKKDLLFIIGFGYITVLN